jgi:nucleotide-binding universal stress UspA family protein
MLPLCDKVRTADVHPTAAKNEQCGDGGYDGCIKQGLRAHCKKEQAMKLLIPVDGSALALAAVNHAIGWIRHGLKANLVLTNVQEPASFYELVTLHDAEAIEQLAEAAGQDTLAPAVALAQAAEVGFEAVVVSGDVVSMLMEVLEAEGCDGVVMGSHGNGLVARALLGSVSQAVLEKSPVPVTFVKPPEPAVEDAQEDDDPTED